MNLTGAEPGGFVLASSIIQEYKRIFFGRFMVIFGGEIYEAAFPFLINFRPVGAVNDRTMRNIIYVVKGKIGIRNFNVIIQTVGTLVDRQIRAQYSSTVNKKNKVTRTYIAGTVRKGVFPESIFLFSIVIICPFWVRI